MSGLRIVPRSQITPSEGQRYLVQGLIPSKDITVVWGEPKSGKTFWVLDLALHVATGTPYRGRPTEHKPVIYCALEGASHFWERLQGLESALGRTPKDDFFGLCPDRFEFGKVRIRDLQGHIVRVERPRYLIKAIEQALPEPPGLIVIDTLNRALSGSENSDEDMTHFTRCLEDAGEAFGCSMIVIHHCGIAKNKPRGHTALTGTCAAQLRVSFITKRPILPGSPFMINTTVEFMKDGPEGEQLYNWVKPTSVGIDSMGQELTSCYVEEAPEPEEEKRSGISTMTSHTKKVLAILQSLVNRSPEKAVDFKVWKENCFLAKIGRTSEARRKAFQRGVDKLLEDKVIQMDRNIVRLHTSTQDKEAKCTEDSLEGLNVE